MNIHKNARLTPHSRAELVRRVLVEGGTIGRDRVFWPVLQRAHAVRSDIGQPIQRGERAGLDAGALQSPVQQQSPQHSAKNH
jgi:hypothetical protein